MTLGERVWSAPPSITSVRDFKRFMFFGRLSVIGGFIGLVAASARSNSSRGAMGTCYRGPEAATRRYFLLFFNLLDEAEALSFKALNSGEPGFIPSSLASAPHPLLLFFL